VSSKRLGRGIEALINSQVIDKSKKNNSPGVSYINLSDIKPNPNQPRHDFDSTSLDELSNSIKEKGVITPITIRETDKGYELIAGERRWRAAKMAKLKSIPGYILNIHNDAEIMEVALIENVQREDLNPIEEAEGYAVLNSKYSLSHDDISKAIGKKRVTISNALRLLKLPSEIRKSIRNGEITAGHGRAILQAKSVSAMKNLWIKIVDGSLSVRAAEALVRPKTKKIKIKNMIHPKAPIRAIENQLIEIFGTKVKLKPAQIGGSIEIVYFSDDDLERIIDLLQSL
jgi:ParB family chromosome partitioning protein